MYVSENLLFTYSNAVIVISSLLSSEFFSGMEFLSSGLKGVNFTSEFGWTNKAIEYLSRYPVSP